MEMNNLKECGRNQRQPRCSLRKRHVVPEPPLLETLGSTTCISNTSVYDEATRGLENLSGEPDTYDERVAFSAFYPSHSNLPVKTSSHLLPLISEPVTAPVDVSRKVQKCCLAFRSATYRGKLYPINW